MLGGIAIFPIEVDQRAPDRGHVLREFAKFSDSDRLSQRRIRQCFAEVRDQARFVALGERLHVKAEHRIERQQHRHRERTLIVFQLVEVAQGDPELAGKCRLRQALLLTQPFQPHAHEGLFHRITFANFANRWKILRRTTLFQPFRR